MRQQVLVLYLATSALDADVVGWARYDGTGRTSPTTGDSDEPPYRTGLDALLDGWRLFQAAQLIPPYPGHEYDTSYLKHEFLFERLAQQAEHEAADQRADHRTGDDLRQGVVTQPHPGPTDGHHDDAGEQQ
jgi:hypothetical protein